MSKNNVVIFPTNWDR